MAFWTQPEYEPIRQYQFRLTVGGAANNTWFWAKQITLPSFEINQAEYTLVNHKFKYPGMLSWNDVSITVVEYGRAANDVMDILTLAGYRCPGSRPCGNGLAKADFYSGKPFLIEQLNSFGEAIKSYSLTNWFIKAARFGEMNYENDEFVNVEMTIGYDCAEIVAGNVKSKEERAKEAEQLGRQIRAEEKSRREIAAATRKQEKSDRESRAKDAVIAAQKSQELQSIVASYGTVINKGYISE